MRISESELILSERGSIYHLDLKPDEIADTVFIVGDPGRVDLVSDYFDTIEVKSHHREFRTHTGTYKGKRLSVLSTGIGTDNIDIVMNELDALANIDFNTRTIKRDLKSLTVIRIGTSGALNPSIPLDSILMSEIAIGFDNLLHFYQNEGVLEDDFTQAFVEHTNWYPKTSIPYVVKANEELLNLFQSEGIIRACTTTNAGFYGPQGRVLRLALQDEHLNDKIASFEYKGIKVSNLEMETAAIYGLSKLLGHRALSLNAIIANRSNKTFSKQPMSAVHRIVQHTLKVLTQ